MTPRRAAMLGSVLGVCNALVVLQLYALVGPDSHAWPRRLAYALAALPLASIALALAAAHPHMASRAISTRVVLALAFATLTTAALSVISTCSGLVGAALVPTLVCALLTESRTRTPRALRDHTGDDAAREQALRLGMLLGATTTLAALIAEGLTHDDTRGLITIVAGAFLPCGLLAGAALGAPFGALAHATRRDAVWVRCLALSTIAAEVVFTLATLFGTRELLGPALAGTVAGCLYLERRTRAAPVVPPAATRR